MRLAACAPNVPVPPRVVELQRRKSDLAKTALEGAATTLSDLGPDDLEFLLT